MFIIFLPLVYVVHITDVVFQCKEHPINQIIYLADLLECCDLQMFWEQVFKMNDLCSQVTGFHDSIRKFVCHVVGISFQTIQRPLLAHLLGGVDGMLKVYPYNILGASLQVCQPLLSLARLQMDLCYFYIGYFLKEHYSNNNNATLSSESLF